MTAMKIERGLEDTGELADNEIVKIRIEGNHLEVLLREPDNQEAADLLVEALAVAVVQLGLMVHHHELTCHVGCAVSAVIGRAFERLQTAQPEEATRARAMVFQALVEHIEAKVLGGIVPKTTH